MPDRAPDLGPDRAPDRGWPRLRRRVFIQAGATAAVLWVSRPSAAATQLSHIRVLSYPLGQVWTTAIRYLRVDRHYAIVDRDPEAGFVVFSFPVGDRQGQGSLEAFETTDAAGRPSTRVKVSTDSGPVHLPHTLVDGLRAKIRAERGQPSTPPPSDPNPAPPKPPGDGPAAPSPQPQPGAPGPGTPGPGPGQR